MYHAAYITCHIFKQTPLKLYYYCTISYHMSIHELCHKSCKYSIGKFNIIISSRNADNFQTTSVLQFAINFNRNLCTHICIMLGEFQNIGNYVDVQQVGMHIFIRFIA